MTRPLVTVFQQIAQPSANPVIPDLNTIIVGPAYVVKDFPDDALEILLSQTYGMLQQPAGGPQQYVPPASGSDAATVTSYPGNTAGAIVDKPSVKLTLKFPRVAMGATYAGAGTVFGTNCTTVNTTGNENKVTVPGADFVAADIHPGDTIILTSSQVSPVQTAIRVVLNVGEPDALGVPTDATSLRLTQNMPTAGVLYDQWTYDALGELRIERTLDTQALVDPSNTYVTFPEPGSDKMVLKGGITLGVMVGTATVQKPLSYSEMYLSYRALRQDLTTIDSVSAGDVSISGAFSSFAKVGKIDARNPLAAALNVALQNAGSAPVYFYGVQADTNEGHTLARDTAAARRDLYCFVVLTQDTNIIAGYKFDWENLASPTYALTNGVPQLFRIVIGGSPLPQATTITPSSIIGEAQIQTGSGSGKDRTLTFAGSPTIDLSQALPGDTVTIGLTPSSGQWASRRGVHQLSHVESSLIIQIEPGRAAWNDTSTDAAGGVECLITSPTGTTRFKRLAFVDFYTTYPTAGLHIESLVPTGVGGPYRVQLVHTGAATPTVSLSGFDVTININAGTTTTQDVLTAINGSATVNTLIEASLIGASAIIAASIPFTSLLVDFTYNDSIDTGSDGIRVRLNNKLTAPATIEYNNTGSLAVTVLGNAITVDYNATVTTLAAIVAAINADASARALVYASLTGVSITSTTALDTLGLQTIATLDQSYINAAVSANHDLYIRLSDSTATFFTSGVRIGDIVEIPIDPNNYLSNAFDGSVISYKIAQVISENLLLVQNLGDDKAAIATELPHGYARDISGKLIDNNPAGIPAAAQNYRIRRNLSKDEQVLDLIAVAQSFLSKRVTMTWPDQVTVAGLQDGSLPRVSASLPAAAGIQPGWYIGAQVGGALAGLPAQQGLTNLGLAGVSKIYHSSGYFSEKQLSTLSDGGWFVMSQHTDNALPFCIHQLTTDVTAIETGELSVVKNVDFVSVFLQTALELFLGQYNVLPETMDDILQSMNTVVADLTNRKIAKIGPPLLSGEVTKIQVSSTSADRVQVFFKGSVPKPLNEIELHVVF